ncbi:alanine:cation symporter family protein [Abyssisolibacter fermentans]|uniref:alanine:cation symporter family protein n=1 Tax=Abyssisolibacter fermentans TaxID=1766203 RepID=UPI001FA72667|nr:alanine:cation symporter family protein [Abyssisolibacter fermentans]
MGNLINMTSSYLWDIFLPLVILLGMFVIYQTIRYRNMISYRDANKWEWSKIKNSISISLSSKIGTGAIIGVLAAMFKNSSNGVGGEGIVLWIFLGMFILVPITYCEVLFSRITEKTPREFIDYNLNSKAGSIYTVCLVILYTFGFVGFQLTGIQSVVKNFMTENIGYSFPKLNVLLFIIVPLIVIVSLIVITKNHKLFINCLASMITTIIILYGLFFLIFLVKTIDFLPKYLYLVWKDFINFKSASIGIPIGLVIGFQRIIQISETGLGTSALASSDGNNSPRREALLQTISTILTVVVAVIITSYVFSYGRYNLPNIMLTQNGYQRITGYFTSVKAVTGYLGGAIIMIFFIISGFTTILGSFHFINTTMQISENKRILFYIILISLSGMFSISNFNVIFDASDLLMFIVSSINIIAMFMFTIKNIKKFKVK